MNTLQVIDLRNLSAELLWEAFKKEALEFSVPSQQLPRKLVSGQFPPSDVYIDKKENVYINMALAGYDPTKVSVKFDEDDYLSVSYKGMEDGSMDSEEYYYLQKNIKFKDFEKKFFVDKKYLDISSDKVQVSIKNGMLSIKIPRKDPDPAKELKINIE
jgi:HSP20 family molecular chaperone IbpA